MCAAPPSPTTTRSGPAGWESTPTPSSIPAGARAGEELAALGRAGTRATDVVHVGDTLSADMAGARAAGITPIHFDPLRACRAYDHRHIRALAGLWQHIRPGVWEETLTMS